ncbi:cell division protein ZapA [Microvirga sp. W0021]|uniref:Cell division protein ZapA n=1 Tax=Hohaiivirga grylli TaxID=3133970 RepID=A0ABV0BNU3_9HYPH
MPQVMVNIAGRSYRMACGEGEEAHLEGLAELFDSRINEMREAFGEIGDMRLHVMAALTVADEVMELRKKLEKTQAELDDVKSLASAGDERSTILEGRFAEKVEKTAERIERLAKSLNMVSHKSD